MILRACRERGFRAQVSSLVILEAAHVLERDFPRGSLIRFYDFLASIDWDLLPVPDEERLNAYEPLIAPKDLHVLASAVEGGSEFLLTLDRRHILSAVERVTEAGLDIRILTPGDFIRTHYPRHEAYQELPPPRS